MASLRTLLQPSLIVLLLATPVWAREMSVQVREGKLRSAPSFLSRVLQTLPYTHRVSILETTGDWLQVQPLASSEKGLPSEKGWMHTSSLTPRKLVLSPGETDAATGVSTEEQALAGKGFNAQVEKEFKQRNADTCFEWVDRMEKLDVPIPEIQQFLKKGGLITSQKKGDA